MSAGTVPEDPRGAILDVVSSILTRSTIHELFEELTGKLSKYVHFDRLALLLLDEARNVVVLTEVYSTLPHGAVLGLEFPHDETPAGEVIRDQKRLYIRDVETDPRYPAVLDLLRQERLHTFCYVPLTSPSHRLGALAFGTRTDLEYTEQELTLVEEALKPVAVAVENILNRRHIEQERDRLKLQLEVNNALVTLHHLPELFEHVSALLRTRISHEFLALSIWDEETGTLRFRLAAIRDQPIFALQDYVVPLDKTASGEAYTKGVPVIYDYARICSTEGKYRENLESQGIRTLCAVPLQTGRRRIGAISLGCREDAGFPAERVAILDALADPLAIAVENALSFAQVEELNRRLSEAKLYLEEELQSVTSSDEILGSSPGVRRMLQQIETVAPTDATVLVYGETGSGKELVARSLHQKSPRSRGTFVKLNCAAIPTGLLESELFGHEKGAFTGAIAQKVGRFEVAHQGTLFLDEIGEIPLELQPKLLRVLQEKEFERLGGIRTIRTDARLVAATNRDLRQMAEANEFRRDLYYRLNVFPIQVPPLRERKEDIPYLAMHFTQEYARRFGRRITALPADSVEQLVRYDWPGNIRELQNLIERSVILTTGETLRIPLQELTPPTAPAAASTSSAEAPSGTMEDVERETILRALRECRGMVGGAKGAAARLGMKRTTLLYRMEKLGIQKPTP
jgi:formate hydrogenlyase transcriptional activator